MLSQLLVFVVLATTVSAFTPRFYYGCNSTHCSYRFEVPEVAAQYVDQNALKQEVTTLNDLVTVLYYNSTSMDDSGLSTFNNTFYTKYQATQPQVDQVSQNASYEAPCFQNSADAANALNAASGQLNILVTCLFNSYNADDQNNCFVQNAVPGTTEAPKSCIPVTTTTKPTTTMKPTTTTKPPTISQKPKGSEFDLYEY